MKLRLYLLLIALASTGCAVRTTAPAEDSGTKFGAAVTAPLEDLNLIRIRIPEVLIEAAKYPYRQIEDLSCEAIAREINELDTALGPDLDKTASAAAKNLLGQGGDVVEESAVDAVRSTTRGVIPFSGWVRKLTGAARHSKEVSKAIAAGIVRRAYLKGIGESQGCKAPAAPLPYVPKEEEQSPDEPEEGVSVTPTR